MELGLSLGEAPKASSFVAKLTNMNKNKNMNMNTPSSSNSKSKDSSFCIPLLSRFSTNNTTCNNNHDEDHDDPSVQLHLVPPNPPPPARLAIRWLSPTTLGGDEQTSERVVSGCRGLDVNVEDGEDDLSSPNSDISSFRIIGGQKRDQEADRGSDDDDNGGNRKKLRLSKQQSAFLEDTFKQHSTLNPKQKLALAKQLNLRPRQVEVWFQNRRARTKLKQTEVDCEYLKKCCETLTEENRRLQKEVQELRALKTSQPYYMQLPATTLTMCPSCEKVVSKPSAAAPTSANRIPVALSLG